MVNYDKNISRLFVIKLSKWFNMVMPVVVLFYQNNGMGMQEIFTLKAIYSVAIVAMVPTPSVVLAVYSGPINVPLPPETRTALVKLVSIQYINKNIAG